MAIEKRPRPEIKIDQGVPLPDLRIRRSYWREHFRKMNVGDSFLIKTLSHRHRAQSAANIYGKDMHQKFAFRRVEDGWRCWRIL